MSDDMSLVLTELQAQRKESAEDRREGREFRAELGKTLTDIKLDIKGMKGDMAQQAVEYSAHVEADERAQKQIDDQAAQLKGLQDAAREREIREEIEGKAAREAASDAKEEKKAKDGTRNAVKMTVILGFVSLFLGNVYQCGAQALRGAALEEAAALAAEIEDKEGDED